MMTKRFLLFTHRVFGETLEKHSGEHLPYGQLLILISRAPDVLLILVLLLILLLSSANHGHMSPNSQLVRLMGVRVGGLGEVRV